MTVSVDLTATGKPQTFRSQTREVFPGHFLQITITNQNGQFAPASGSLNISGDLTFSTDDANGIIGNFRSGEIIAQKL